MIATRSDDFEENLALRQHIIQLHSPVPRILQEVHLPNLECFK